MPDVGSDSSAVSAREREGYPFGLPGSGVRGGDAAAEVDEPGDLPDALHAPRGERRGFWRLDEEAAIREAKRTGRGLLVSFWADWSEDCVELHQKTLRDPSVRAAIFGGYVPLRIDVTEESRLGRIQLQRYGVAHLPAVILLDDEGNELDRVEELISEKGMLERLHTWKVPSKRRAER
jgi:thiol:disulfide interchange protein